MQLGAMSFFLNDTLITQLDNIQKTESALERTRGLLNRPALQQDEGLWISPCNSVHTIGMKYPLDIIYIDKNNIIKKIVSHLKPLRLSICWTAFSTLELLSGSSKRLNLETGLRVEWQHNV